ncbi:MAG: hypothetical protein ABSE22_21290 [Xanthobacteraceae bacterium]
MLGMIALFAPLFAILAASLWYAARAWTAIAGPPMPLDGYVSMTLGVVFSLVVGCGLMALLFYSSRHGYDEQSYDNPAEPDIKPIEPPGDRT